MVSDLEQFVSDSIPLDFFYFGIFLRTVVEPQPENGARSSIFGSGAVAPAPAFSSRSLLFFGPLRGALNP